MKPKLIEVRQENLIECDTPGCGYQIVNPTPMEQPDISMYINEPCPLCGGNLLTQKDYDDSEKFKRMIGFLNKWFWWMAWFRRKRASEKTTSVKIHSGFHIKKQP